MKLGRQSRVIIVVLLIGGLLLTAFTIYLVTYPLVPRLWYSLITLNFDHLDPPRFQVDVKIPKARYEVEETLFLSSLLINQRWRPITIIHSRPLFWIEVYTEKREKVSGNKEVVLIYPYPEVDLLIYTSATLRPGRPYYPYPFRADVPRDGSFSLQFKQSGRYKIVIAVSFTLKTWLGSQKERWKFTPSLSG